MIKFNVVRNVDQSFHLNSTPPKMTDAFEDFKKDAGSAIYKILKENKGKVQVL